jgi:hypothetical protein
MEFMERFMAIPTTKKKPAHKATLLIAAVVVLMLAVYFMFVSPGSNLKEPIKEQLAAIRVDDTATAYSYTSHSFQDATSLEAFKRIINSYSSLRNNERIKFISSELLKNMKGIGKVQAILISRGGVETAVAYQLVQENNHWKIDSIIITPQGDEDGKPTTPAATSLADTTSPANNQEIPGSEPAKVAETSTQKSSNLYQDQNNNYSVTYPAAWQYNKADNDMVVFNNTAGTTPSQATVVVHALSMNAEPLSVQEMADKNEALIKDKAGSYKVAEDGLLPPRSNKNDNFHGKYSVFTYTLNNQPMKQLQIIYFKSPKRAQYVIDYIAPEAQFDMNLPAAKSIIASFTIS